MLSSFLMDVLDACHSAALVVATMCDLVANNVKALKQLVISKRHLSSGFVIKKLQQCLILISLNAHITFSLNMMW